ncbi:c-type cytochrome [Vibrio lentus]|uniref:Cytochrome C n=1 Tax=Vibrio lentus TaxID=136468 RepID=A0A855IQV8_9VIBR|nr:c-type cytochrome [Vibrio lentus]PMJ60369.1 cytochrome C [Vibrio lentus]PMM53919.1 cytochrome C [Vibrio lentus]PMM59032.1 cytochrome C [Vibrio lentus]
MTTNSMTFVSIFLAPAIAVLLLSACSDEQSESDTRVVPKIDVELEKAEPYIPSLVAGEKLAQNLCSQCHGDKIIPFVQSYPNIKGQKASYILKQLRDFKSDERQDLYMQSVVKSLSDRDLQDAAAFYSTLKPLDLYKRSKEYYHQ